MTNKEQIILVQRVLDNEVSKDDVFVFQEHFRNHRAFRQLYYEHAFITTSLEASADFQMGVQERRGSSLMTLEKKRLMKISVVWAAAAVVIFAIVAHFTYVLPKPASNVAQLAFAAGSLWSVEHSDQASNTNSDEAVMRSGSTLKLDQGVVELSFPSGIKAILEGDSQLTFQGENRFYLNHGKIWFDVPDGAEGVELTTPRMTVLDLGTKFGVISIGKVLDEVHVLNGKVEVTTQLGRKKTSMVDAGSAISVNYIGQISERELAANSFSSKLPTKSPYLHWSFDAPQKEENKYHLAVSGEHPLISSIQTRYNMAKTKTATSRSIKGKHGNAFCFLYSSDSIGTDYPGVAGKGPRTVAFWLRVDPDNYQMPEIGKTDWSNVLGWGLRHSPNYSHTGNSQTESFQVIIGTPQIGQVQGLPKLVPILSFEGVWFEGKTDLADGQWHHIVWVFNGKMKEDLSPDVTCYCDGSSERLQVGGVIKDALWIWPPKIDTVTNDAKSVPLKIATNMLPNTTKKNPLPAQIDELFVIEAAISANEAQTLYDTNKYEPASPMRRSSQ